jgi:uncharacterized membrane protein (UPF0127 family)
LHPKAFNSLSACLAALALVACAPAASTAPAAPAPEPVVVAEALEPLEILTDGGPVRFRVAIADTEQERNRGLMYRSVLDEDEGMLFDFHTPRPVAFWMKNTLIPLDMIFIGADGRIVNIAADTRPHSLDPVPSDGPVLAVLEIGGGLSVELGIEPGDRVVHRIFPGG